MATVHYTPTLVNTQNSKGPANTSPRANDGRGAWKHRARAAGMSQRHADDPHDPQPSTRSSSASPTGPSRTISARPSALRERVAHADAVEAAEVAVMGDDRADAVAAHQRHDVSVAHQVASYSLLLGELEE